MQAEKLDLDGLTTGLATKSDKIRELGRRGVPTAEIARYLGIRYQHARNVLVAAGLHLPGEGSGPVQDGAERETPAMSAKAPPRYAWVQVDASGRVALPGELVAAAGLGSGPAHVRLTDDGIEILSQRAALARAQAIAAQYRRPGVSVVDEFIAERRREAERESE